VFLLNSEGCTTVVFFSRKEPFDWTIINIFGICGCSLTYKPKYTSLPKTKACFVALPPCPSPDFYMLGSGTMVKIEVLLGTS
jgi:hypothetical protein